MADRHLRFGTFLAPFHSPDENPTLALERDLDLLVHMDELGYDEAWIGEHHSGGYEIIASPEVFIAFAASRTKRIRLGTGVSSLAYHHPFINADRINQLDHMTRGRVMFGVGPGSLPSDAFAMGFHPKEQRRRMNEAIDVLVPLLRGERVNAETDWFTLVDAKLQLSSYTKPMVEMAVASLRSPSGALAAGKHGIGLLSLGGTNDEALAFHAENWRKCEEAADEHGQSVDRNNWRIVTLMHIAETREQAEANVQFGIEAFADYFRHIAPTPIVPQGVTDPVAYLRESQMAVIGTPDDAIEHIERLWQGSGGFGALLDLAHDWADREHTWKSHELLARYVMPHFQGSMETRREAYTHTKKSRALYVGAVDDAIKTEIQRYEDRKSGKAAGDD
ncbi:MAG: LLM class flavin-dependent oxidoreductase [Rhodospirillaceae bacterium]|jgi:limonene 1,2-monooxygenase|nr:LLM class flavin-dependent oxidoreductase [Rhodospirillaceae bacterium]MBT3930519.1 LLM class flavin-dependent oxidoreductase [Rhodospirillaceae bacterium]MBT4773031.1 LLM class flavin-dependent oxidoreductase [Rhodospirillaceae bacterium]MBT5359061.1 LLM class flavin-dependent oxidoreductase [Rhodospirillaceae bacterium]MBT5767865.1 LLM class flavin-dependent oxidoreductase [Rhodospirillaceae bacterium]